MTDSEKSLVAALATLIDALATKAPRDFLEAACKDGMIAIERATGGSYADLEETYFTWGRTDSGPTPQQESDHYKEMLRNWNN